MPVGLTMSLARQLTIRIPRRRLVVTMTMCLTRTSFQMDCIVEERQLTVMAFIFGSVCEWALEIPPFYQCTVQGRPHTLL